MHIPVRIYITDLQIIIRRLGLLLVSRDGSWWKMIRLFSPSNSPKPENINTYFRRIYFSIV